MGITGILPFLITGAGIYFIFKLRAFFIIHPIRVAKDIGTELKNKNALSSLMLALAGTLGVGNIVGVGVGIAVGGAGSVFWLIFSSLFSSVIKYAEVTLSSYDGEDGMAGVIKRSYRRTGKYFSLIYLALTLILSLTMGSALQARSISECAEISLGIAPAVLAIPFLLILLILTLGGAEKIENAVKIIIPLTTIIYITMCLCVIIPAHSKIPDMLYDIMKSAFTPSGATGGAVGIFSSAALKEGFARGMLSNEAGAGTSSLSHMRAGERKAAIGGIYGMLEVLFDTVILCPLSAFAILLSPGYNATGGGIFLIVSAFSSLGPFFSYLFFIIIFFFAISTILCWYYYGSYSCERLIGKKFKYLYLFLYITVSLGGLFFSSSVLFALSDVILLLMSVLTIIALIIRREDIKKLTLGYL